MWSWTLNWDELPGKNIIIGSCPRKPDDVARIAKDAGATAILSLQDDPCHEHMEIDYAEIRSAGLRHGLTMARTPMTDFNRSDQAKRLPNALRALNALLEAGHTVYVHCTAGINRAPLSVVAKMAFIDGVEDDAAFAFVKTHRTVAEPYRVSFDDCRKLLLDGQHERIAAEAFEIYQKHGNPDSEANWKAAERHVLKQIILSGPAPELHHPPANDKRPRKQPHKKTGNLTP